MTEREIDRLAAEVAAQRCAGHAKVKIEAGVARRLIRLALRQVRRDGKGGSGDAGA